MITTGSILDKFEVLEKIGEGGMATVYRGRHVHLNREVAVKVMHPHLASSAKNRTRFQREAGAIDRVKHPNILAIESYSGPDEDDAWIMTELIDGPTLRELLDDVGAMMPEPAALIALKLCKALDAAHGFGIVHRDLKPENVMFDADGEVKLMDFGIARVLTDVQVTMTGALVGSPAYMSPEQATDGDLDARSDLFSLGTVIYRMVTGALPFRGNNPSVVLKAIIDGTYEDPSARVPSLDHAMAAIICKCLATKPDDRFPNAGEVGKALVAYLKSVGIDPEQPGPWSLSDYIADADAYEERLAVALIAVLTTRGRAEAERGDAASALRTFNRVLALDEENTEVVDIIQGMRRPLADDKRGVHWFLWVAPTLVLLTALGALAMRTDGFTQWEGATPASEPLPSLGMAPKLPVHKAEIPDPTESPPEATPEPAVAALPEPATPPRATPSAPGEASPPDIARTEELPPDDEPEPLAARPACVGENTLKIPSTGNQQVSVNGADPRFPPFEVVLPAGMHRIELIESKYHLPRVFEVEVCGGTPPKLASLAQKLKPSRLRLAGYPATANVVLDSRVLGTVGDHSSVLLDQLKTYSLQIVQDGETLGQHTVTRGETPPQLLPGEMRTLNAP